MAKKKDGKSETKSDFLRKALSKNPELEFSQINRLWTQRGHPGQISNALYYQVRSKLGIRTIWTWEKLPEPEPSPKAGSRPSRESASSRKPRLEPIPSEVYQFKVTLQDSDPPIWRRFQVSDCTLDKLHEHIQTAMGWTNSHLHHFTIAGRQYGDPYLMGENFVEFDYADSTTTNISEILPKNGERYRFAYEYDFGDSWQHEILFEGRLPADPDARYPLCLEGARACPPEDVGGVWGYADFMEAIADPENDQHGMLLEWIGGEFDPESFDAAAASMSMKRGLPDWRSLR